HRRHPAAADTGHLQAQEDLLREASAAGRQDPVCARVGRGSGKTPRAVGLDRAGHGRARGRRLADARARLAHVYGRADVAVVAGAGVGPVRAARGGVARIVGAWVAVIAAEAAVACAGSVRAGVVGRAGVTIVAGARVERVPAARARVARVVGARVAVVAAQQGAGAGAAGAGVAGGTRIAVVAGGGVGGVHTTRVGPAGVVGADVAVVAGRRCAAHTLPAGAGVVRRAGVGILAGRRVGGVHAPRLGPAGVVGADVAVVARSRRPGTAAEQAGVGHRACIAVVAGLRVETREPAGARGVAGRVAADAPRRAGRAGGVPPAGGGAAVAVDPVAVVALLERVEEAVATDLDRLPGDGEEVGLDAAPG